MEITVATYNVLAASYAEPRFYPRTPPEVLDPARRVPRLAGRVADLAGRADVIGLQEVERTAHEAIAARLRDAGPFGAAYAQKGLAKPDGCSTFHRERVLRVASEHAMHYGDGSGHVALLVVLEDGRGARVGVANTHLKWDPPDAPRVRQHAQALELLSMIRRADAACPWILLGDFNAEPSSTALAALRDAGFADAHAPQVATCNPNGRAKKIDYLLHDARLEARAIVPPPPVIDDETPLPSETEPSDHLPLLAAFRFGVSAP